jgi:hypothetical protein
MALQETRRALATSGPFSYRLRQFEQAGGSLQVSGVQDDGRRRCGSRGPGNGH